MTAFESNIISIYGEKARQWLGHLPNHVAQLANTYGLSNLKAVNNLSYNYVLSGFQRAQAINITANVIKQLHKATIPSTHAFPHIKDWLSAVDKDWTIPNHYLQKARKLRDELLQTSKPDVLLHGDLHHDNILQNGEDWLVIDPKGVIGEPAYEVAAFIRNPIPELLTHADAPNIIQDRITRFAELLGIPAKRIHDWCFVESVLSWIWNIQDKLDTEYFIKLTKIFNEGN